MGQGIKTMEIKALKFRGHCFATANVKEVLITLEKISDKHVLINGEQFVKRYSNNGETKFNNGQINYIIDK